MSFVTPAHVRQLAEAEFGDLPVLAIDTDGEIAIFPQSTAQVCCAEILTDAAELDEYTDGEDLDDVLAAQFAAEINEAYGLGLIDETGDYTVSVALTDDVADNGRSTVEVLRREQIGEVDGETFYALGGKIAGWTIPVPTDAD